MGAAAVPPSEDEGPLARVLASPGHAGGEWGLVHADPRSLHSPLRHLEDDLLSSLPPSPLETAGAPSPPRVQGPLSVPPAPPRLQAQGGSPQPALPRPPPSAGAPRPALPPPGEASAPLPGSPRSRPPQSRAPPARARCRPAASPCPPGSPPPPPPAQASRAPPRGGRR